MRVAIATGLAFVCACSTPEEVPAADLPAIDAEAGIIEIEPMEIEASIEAPSEIETISVAAMRRRLRSQLSPEEQREALWDLAHLPQEEAEATALMRVWGSEVEWTNERDMIGIWQVVQNVRARHCDVNQNAHARRRITQCRTATGEVVSVEEGDDIEGAEETVLSALRRLSERALGIVDARTRRGAWISSMTLDCSEPEGWPRTRGPWDRSTTRANCEQYAPLARELVSGETRRQITQARVIAWGGRCERHCDDPADPSTCRQTGACDDSMACRRGLTRIHDTTTSNAFWCRPGTPHCPDSIDPICEHFGVEIDTDGEDSVVTDLTAEAPSA